MPEDRHICEGNTRRGEKCSRSTNPEDVFCWQHRPGATTLSGKISELKAFVRRRKRSIVAAIALNLASNALWDLIKEYSAIGSALSVALTWLLLWLWLKTWTWDLPSLCWVCHFRRPSNSFYSQFSLLYFRLVASH